MSRFVEEGQKEFTASVWILNMGYPRKMLLIHHKKLGKWMQPGGHVEKFENPVDTAVREVKEETGIDISFLFAKLKRADGDATFLPVPRFLIEQEIPAYKDQPKHYHLDINYVVEVQEKKPKTNEKETHGIGWFTKEEILKLAIHEDTKVVVNELL